MAQLGLPRPKLPKHLRDGASLDPACVEKKKHKNVSNPTAIIELDVAVAAVLRTQQKFVELLGARGDLDDLGSPLVELRRRGEAHRHEFGSFGLRRDGEVKRLLSVASSSVVFR